MDQVILWNPDKNRWLSETRGITFDEVLAFLEAGVPPESYDHPNQGKYPGQKIFEIEAKGYVWMINPNYQMYKRPAHETEPSRSLLVPVVFK